LIVVVTYSNVVLTQIRRIVIARAKPEAIHWYSTFRIASPNDSQWRHYRINSTL